MLLAVDLTLPDHLTPKEVGLWTWRIFVDHGVPVLVMLVAGWLILRAVRIAGRRLTAHARAQAGDRVDESVRRADTVAMLLNYIARIFVVAIAVLVVLEQFGTNVAPFLTGAGILGVLLGFGAQSLVKDVLNGIFIFTENQFSIGDVVGIAGKTGVVEAINLRTTILRGDDGAMHVVPNGQITVASNLSFHWANAIVDLRLPMSENAERVLTLLNAVCAEAKGDPSIAKDLLGDPVVTGPESFVDGAMQITVTVRVRPLRQWEIARRLRLHIKSAFDRAGISVAIPQRVVQVRSGDPIAPAR